MAFNKKTWEDREVQFPDRRTLINIETLVAQTFDIQRAEGAVTSQGTQLSADTFNDLEDRIANAVSDIDDQLADKQATLTAGTGISIDENNVISISLTDADTQEY